MRSNFFRLIVQFRTVWTFRTSFKKARAWPHQACADPLGRDLIDFFTKLTVCERPQSHRVPRNYMSWCSCYWSRFPSFSCSCQFHLICSSGWSTRGSGPSRPLWRQVRRGGSGRKVVSSNGPMSAGERLVWRLLLCGISPWGSEWRVSGFQCLFVLKIHFGPQKWMEIEFTKLTARCFKWYVSHWPVDVFCVLWQGQSVERSAVSLTWLVRGASLHDAWTPPENSVLSFMF